jgi:hypothetical protein
LRRLREKNSATVEFLSELRREINSACYLAEAFAAEIPYFRKIG